MFPPSDSHSQENSSDAYPEGSEVSHGGGSNGNSTALVEDRRSQNLVPFNGGMMAPGGPWSFGPTRPEILTATPTFGSLIHALRRRLWLAVFVGLILGGGLGYLCWRLMPTKYESVCELKIRAENPSIWTRSDGGVDFGTYKSDALAALKSDTVIAKVLDDKTVQNVPVIREHGLDAGAWLADNINVHNPEGSEFVLVSLRYEDSNGLTDIVNALVNAYMDEAVTRDRDEKLRRRDTLDKKLENYKATLAQKRTQYHEMSIQMQAPDAAAVKAQSLIQNGELQAAISAQWEAKRQYDEVEMEIAMTKAAAASASAGQLSDQDVQDAYNHDARITGAQNDLELLQSRYRKLQNVVVSKNDPELLQLRDSLRQLEKTIEDYRLSDRNMLQENAKRNADQNGVRQKFLEAQKDFYQHQIDTASKRVQDQAVKVANLEHFNSDLEALGAEIVELNNVVGQMDETLTQWNIELDAPSRVEKRGDATAARPVDQYKQYGMAAFGGLLGFGLALACATFYEFFSRRLNSASEVDEGLGIRVMGDLPALRRRRLALRPRSRQAIHGLVAESINSIRAALVRNSEPGACNVYLVSSAVEQEGKTTVASQLAASLARSGRRTLLIDCDLRHPGAHHVFGLTNEYGFSELLRGEVHIDDAIRATPADNLWMITAGHCCAQAVLMLGKDTLGEIFTDLESRFDFIVVDAGPVLKVADPMLLGQYVDGAILSVLRDVSQIHKVYEASERLKLAGVKVVGAVINGVDEHSSFDRYNIELPAA